MRSSWIAFLKGLSKWLTKQQSPAGRWQEAEAGIVLLSWSEQMRARLKGAGNHSLILLQRQDSATVIQVNPEQAACSVWMWPSGTTLGKTASSWNQLTWGKGSQLLWQKFPIPPGTFQDSLNPLDKVDWIITGSAKQHGSPCSDHTVNSDHVQCLDRASNQYQRSFNLWVWTKRNRFSEN